MASLKNIFGLIGLLFLSFSLLAQGGKKKKKVDENMTFGIRASGNITSLLFSNQEFDFDLDGRQYNIDPNLGTSYGAQIRVGLGTILSMQVGLGYITRVYETSVFDGQQDFGGPIRLVSFEFPVTGIVYVPMNERFFLNASFGAAAEFYPSDNETVHGRLRTLNLRFDRVLPKLIAATGVEYRTEYSGYWYLGVSYHRVLNTISLMQLAYEENSITAPPVSTELVGHYFGIDLVYFFSPTSKPSTVE